MHRALRLLVALVLVSLVGCGGDDDAETADSIPLEQRVLTAEDAPGFKPDPVEKGQTTVDYDEFIEELTELAVDPDLEEMTGVFEEDGFEGAVTDTRFYGETHTRTAPHVMSSVVHVQSEKAAASALDWLEADIKKPCPDTCAVQRSEFEVDDIPGARGLHQSATAKDIERVGAGERPFDGYWVGFTDGPYVYTVDLHGPPGSVTEEQALEIATAYYERLAGN